GVMKGDFSIRLEHCVTALFAAKKGASIAEQRTGVAEALHETALKTLRSALDDVLFRKDRVAILIDNLDKAWGSHGDVAQLSEFLLGLFSAGNQLLNDFSRSDSRRKPVNCTAAIFLRSDIFNKIIEIAHEPDKIAVTRLEWDDPELLLQVIESRYLAAHPEALNGSEIWNKYFCTTVRGTPTKDYITSRTLPRPRDVVYLVKNAISAAVNRGHSLIEETDIAMAEYEYSTFAMDSIMVENSITSPQLEAVLYEFAGCSVVVTGQEIAHFFRAAKIPDGLYTDVTEHLVKLSFLGIEVSPNKFAFSEEPREYRKNVILASKLQSDQEKMRYQVHPAFRAYLEIADPNATVPI
ncbi:MAG: P-loop ATPase, Sll1717 family, partial [Candidatus Acidiferrales bacterium]